MGEEGWVVRVLLTAQAISSQFLLTRCRPSSMRRTTILVVRKCHYTCARGCKCRLLGPSGSNICHCRKSCPTYLRFSLALQLYIRAFVCIISNQNTHLLRRTLSLSYPSVLFRCFRQQHKFGRERSNHTYDKSSAKHRLEPYYVRRRRPRTHPIQANNRGH